MFFRKRMIDYHQAIIDQMAAAHYPDVYSGVCFGIAGMGLQAILLRDTATYDKRMKEMARKPVILEHTDEGLRSIIPQNDRAFFDGVSVYQSPTQHPDLFNKQTSIDQQKILLSAPLVVPDALLRMGGITSASSFSGIYDKNELYVTLKSLRSCLQKQALKQPVGLLLTSNNHAFTLGFDPQIKKWMLIESNNGPTELLSDAQAAKKIIEIFSSNNYAAFHTGIFTTGDNQAATRRAIAEWQASADFQRIHSINDKRATAMTSSGCTLLYIAAQHGNAKLVRELLDHGADVNLSTYEVPPALYIASCFGYIDVVREILARGAYVKPDYYTGVSPLIAAANHKHIAIVKLLRDNGADIFEIIHDKEIMKMLQDLREDERVSKRQAPAMS